MIFPIILLVLSLAGTVGALIFPGFRDLLLLAGPCALASLVLLLTAYRRRRIRRARGTQSWIVVDGSNVMHWKGGTPAIGTVREVVDRLTALGFVPGVMFDANAGYKLNGKYQHDGTLGELLGLPQDRVMVVPKGAPADPTILAAARDLGARIVTNDRFTSTKRAWIMSEARHTTRRPRARSSAGTRP